MTGLQTIESKVSVTFEPAVLKINDFEKMKEAIENMASFYDSQVITREQKKGAESSRAELINMEKQLEEERKRIKAIYNKPLQNYETQMKELVSIIQRPLNQIRDGLKEIEQGERDERESVLIRYLIEKSEEFNLPEMGIEVEQLQQPSWLNKGNFTQKGVGSKLAKEIDDVIYVAVKDKKQREVNEQVIRSFCETVEVEPEGWLAQLEYKAPTEIMQTIQDNLKADKERLDRIERDRKELTELEEKNAQTLEIEVVEPFEPIVIEQQEPIIMDTIQVRGTLTQLKALNAWAVVNGVEVTPYEPGFALDDLPF
ncbi:DUF1351 domain-containing protein [Jeotgalibaca porci]|uniref:DUF1351 domain-containing protein n=1 Tax=Jeotgalibaca porci TaxID=1868793 RepID=UPI00359FAA6B